MQKQEEQFKQLPMLLPAEKNMPNVRDAEVPLMPPPLPSSTINTTPAVKPPTAPLLAPALVAPVPLPANK